MSFDLFICDPPTPCSEIDVHALYQRAMESEAPEAGDDDTGSPRIASFYAVLCERFPPLEDLDEQTIDNAPWSVSPGRSDSWVSLALRFSAPDGVIEEIAALATLHSLVLLDPQDGRVYWPDGRES